MWRVSTGVQFGSALTVLAWGALSLGLTVSGVATNVLVMLWCMTVAVALIAWRWTFVPSATLGPASVVIQNPLRRSSVVYTDIAAVRPGYGGTTIVKRSGGRVTIWAVQKSNAATWRNWQTRADDLAAAIMARTVASHPAE